MNETTAIRVLLVDDHALLREGLATVLGRHPDMTVVAAVGNAASALLAYRKHRPDVAVIDMRLPDEPGVNVVRELRRDYPGGRFVILTTYDSHEDVYRAFSAGVSAYVLKDAATAEIVEVIRAVHGGARLIPEGVREMLAYPRLHVDLSQREREVLRLVAQGLANKEIALDLGISAETVKTYLDRIRVKLDGHDRAALAAKALKLGLIEL